MFFVSRRRSPVEQDWLKRSDPAKSIRFRVPEEKTFRLLHDILSKIGENVEQIAQIKGIGRHSQSEMEIEKTARPLE